MTTRNPKSVPRRLSRRATLGGLAGSVAGLALLRATPMSALARSAPSHANTVFTRGQTLSKYKGMPGGIFAVDWSPDGRHIASTGFDSNENSSVVVWEALTGNQMSSYNGDGNFFVYSGEWSPDGTRIATGTGIHQAKIWDAASGQILVTYAGHAGRLIRTVEWSPDGKRCASACHLDFPSDPTVHVWDSSTGAHLLTYSGHVQEFNGIAAVAWSPMADISPLVTLLRVLPRSGIRLLGSAFSRTPAMHQGVRSPP